MQKPSTRRKINETVVDHSLVFPMALPSEGSVAKRHSSGSLYYSTWPETPVALYSLRNER
jgi:hypothetical protein